MPDSSSWYQNFQRNTHAAPTQVLERWADAAGPHARTSTFGYAPNAIDLVVATNAAGILVVSNFFNNQQQAFFSTSFSATSLNQGAPITVGAAGIQANGGAGGFGTDQYNYANYIPARSVSASIGLKF